MSRDEFIACVPVHECNGRPFFIRVADIPDPWRVQFLKVLVGSQCPAFEGEGDLAYVWDWEHWVNGNGHDHMCSRGLDAKRNERP